MTIVPTLEEIKTLHSKILKANGGLPGVRDENLLESAIAQVNQNVFGQELYPTLQEKVARLGYSLITNHCFNDGNKRIGFMAMMYMLTLNDIDLKVTSGNNSYKFILDVAAGKKDYQDVVKWIEHISTI